MKPYMHPVSMTSRPVRLFIAERGIDVEEQVTDLMTGEHHEEPFISINPNRLVPVLDDGDFRLTESSAILKYLADKIDSPAYPKDLKQRAKVNEMMDWFNTNFYRDYGYGQIYPQIFPHHKRPSDEAQNATIADYFGVGLLTLGEIIRCDFSAYPNIERWLGNMKQLKSWPETNEALYGFADAVKDQPFEAI